MSKFCRSLFGRSQRLSRGFSLLEVVITLAIISILTVMVMTRYGSFNSAVLLKNQAYEVALDVREAQTFAINARSDVGEDTFRDGYGIYFDMSDRQTYLFWRDEDGSNRYTDGDDTSLNRIGIDTRFRIREICIDGGSGCTTAQRLSVAFVRPNFDAVIYQHNGSGWSRAELVEIRIESVDDPTAATRSVLLTSTGQIAVQ